MKGINMWFSRRFKVTVCFALSLFMSNIPNVAVASSGMISTSEVVSRIDRAQEQQKVQDVLARGDVQKMLIENGVAPMEVSARLASLSDKELLQLSSQVEQAQAGGDILVVILLVVLIIFLVKRI
ncbi:MAG: PA2779 family protein [Bdellovibrionota bacterium]